MPQRRGIPTKSRSFVSLLFSLIAISICSRNSLAAFTKQQLGCRTSLTGTGLSSETCTLGSIPATGDVVVCGIMWYNGGSPTTAPTLSISDGNNNTYTKSANSPSATNAATTGAPYIFYL